MNPLHVLVRLKEGVASRLRNVWFRALGAQLQGYVWMRRISIPRNWAGVKLEAGVALDDGVVLLVVGDSSGVKLVIGAETYINRMTVIDACERVEIGRRCMIGPHCYITDHDHGHNAGQPIGIQSLVSAPVRIGNNVWVGAGATVLKGVTLGDNAVIAAGAVVTHDVPAGGKVAGVPARSLAVRT